MLLLSIEAAVASDDRSLAALTSTRAESPASDISLFFDRLMLAESGGRNTAANPRSSALGPFQFIRSTFAEVARRNFTAEVAALSDEKLLELRTDRAFSRRAAEAFTAENAAFLKQQGHPATFTNLRLAFLLGAPGAARVLQAPP